MFTARSLWWRQMSLKSEILKEVIQLRSDVTKLMSLVAVESTKIDAVNASVDTLTTGSTKALADIAAEIQALKGNTTLVADPTASAALDSILTKVTTLSANISSADPGQINPTPPASTSPNVP